jgi:uncharacterized protein (TIGR03435 family)|nr:TIGR03435 family protein [Candidatus Acidoferrales bacterium]
MPGVIDLRRRRAAALVSVSAFLLVASAFVFSLMGASPSFAAAQAQSAAANATEFRYEVVSIKPNRSSNGGNWQNAPDGFTGTNVPLQFLVLRAFGFQDFQLTGAPGWITSERFDIDAKMDTSVVEALQKLNPDDQKIARQRMLQTVLAERFQLTFHRESKVFQVYSLVVAKNGSKLHEAKPGDTYQNGIKYPNGGGGAGATMVRMGPTSHTLTAQAVAISSLVNQLRLESPERPVVDKTGLTGKYDFTLTYAPENVSAAVPGAAPNIPDAPGAPSLFVALEEQLGLKLESGKAPIEIVVIDHVERPSGN